MEGNKVITEEKVKDVFITFRDDNQDLRDGWVDWFFDWWNPNQIKFKTKRNIYYYPIEKLFLLKKG